MVRAMAVRASSLVTVLVSCGVALLLAEGVARLVLPPLPYVEVRDDPGAVERRREENESDQPGLYVYTPVGLRLRANKVAIVENHDFSGLTFEMRTNSLGYRNREVGPKTSRRVLFLGDSITLAGYMDEVDTFVRRVETLSREDGGSPYETINAGVGGISIADELAILEETGLGTDPDVVVVCFYLNDAIPSPAVVLRPAPTGLGRSRLWSYLSLAWAERRDAGREMESVAEVPDLGAWLREVEAEYPGGPGDIRTDRAAFNLAIARNFRDWGTAWSDDAWGRILPVLKEIARLADVHHFRMLLVCFPLRAQVEAEYLADEPQRRLERAASDLDVPYLDLLPVFRQAFREQETPLFFDQCHPTPAGHGIVAEAILEFLRRADR